MTLVGVNVRRTLQLLLAVVLLFGATTVIASQSADAAFPGGNQWIAFVDTGHIWVIGADGSNLTQLTDDGDGLTADPVFSADGSKLAFALDPGTGDSAVWVADFLNGDTSSPSLGSPTQVSNGPIDGAPTWSPDGTQIAYQRRAQVATGTATSDNGAGVTLIDTGATFVTDNVAAGDIVTNTTDGYSTGTVATVDSETQITLAAQLSGGTNNDWGTGDAYTIKRPNRQIFKSPSNGSNLTGTLLSPTDSDLSYTDESPTWSPDGTKIAFVSTALEANPNVLVMSATDGSSRTNVTTDGIGFDNVVSFPAWSPDGARIAFETPKDAGFANTADSNIWTVTAAGADPQFVVGSSDDEVEPAWSPDGTLIVYRRSGTGGDKLYAIASDGSGSAARIGSASSPATNGSPDWQPVLKGVPDTATVDEHGSVNIDVLANDLTLADAVGTATTSSTLVVSPTKGLTVRQGDGSFTYTHTGPEIGTSSTTDTFTYTVTQGSLSSTAVVTVTINPVNDPPTAVADSYDVSHGATLNVPAGTGVLANDSDPENAALSAVKVTDPAHGTLTLNANGSFTYTNDGSSSAATTDSFTYKANDGTNDSAPATVTLNVGPENPNPPSVTVAGPSFGAPGAKATFTSTVTEGSGAKTYAWSVKLGASEVATGSSATLEFTPSASGAYTVELTVTDDAGLGTDSAAFTVMSDISSSIFVGDIVWLANEGITKGCNPPTNDQYCPNQNVTRGQMAAFLVRFLGLTDAGTGNLFTDDNGSVFEHNIDVLATAGITKGCNPPANDNFCPNDYVTRGQMAAFLVRALGLTDNGGGNLFTDDNGSVFENNIDILATAGITKGCNAAGDQFCPNDYVTRGQMAAFLHRAAGLS